jgi:putative flippase GtrA
MTQASDGPPLRFAGERYGRFLRGATDLMKYGLASVAALALDYALLLLCHRVGGLNYLIAAAIGFLAGMMLIYLLSIRYVFGDRRRVRPRREFLGFFAIGVIGLLFNEVLLLGFVDQLGLSVASAKLPTAAFVFLFNFAARRSLLFSASTTFAGEGSCLR